MHSQTKKCNRATLVGQDSLSTGRSEHVPHPWASQDELFHALLAGRPMTSASNFRHVGTEAYLTENRRTNLAGPDHSRSLPQGRKRRRGPGEEGPRERKEAGGAREGAERREGGREGNGGEGQGGEGGMLLDFSRFCWISQDCDHVLVFVFVHFIDVDSVCVVC